MWFRPADFLWALCVIPFLSLALLPSAHARTPSAPIAFAAPSMARTTAEYCLTSQGCQSQCINDGPPPPPRGPDPPPIDEGALYRPPASTFAKRDLVGYWSSWSQYYGEDPGTPGCKKADMHLPELINPHLYTHINYAFVFISDTNYTMIPHELDDEDLSLRLNTWCKRVNPSLKTLVSIGGWTFNDGPGRFTGGIDYSRVFSKMAASAANRATFIRSCIDWCRRLGFDGIDIDWEYPGDVARGGTLQDGANLLTLYREMREAFHAEAIQTGRTELLMTMAAPADPDKVELFDPAACAQYLDWFNLMSYDFYGNWENIVDSTAPVKDTHLPTWSYESAIKLYLRKGVSPRQINAGLPAYGRVWTLDDVTKNLPGDTGHTGVAGRCTGLTGYLAYFEIMDILNAQNQLGTAALNYHYVLNDGAYLTFDDQWVGFDNENSVAEKVGIIQKYDLRGGMIWAIDLDTKSYEFTRAVAEHLNACQQDDPWLPTPPGQLASAPCTVTGPGAESGAVQTRRCREDSTWDVVDNGQCLGAFKNNLAARTCVGDY
ncbi:uncharacterized protein PSFLO_05737 [Pseudozyma flocculosa]|uniref:GH18 domain-containing protein n=1 Tax=Pseudozyma flocculosa TaxID=84751 RepID=A0A5C3F9E3_9BASI|nr:uncharacterized protein PSFLO_05737 [Pseudozyma flocculosa]